MADTLSGNRVFVGGISWKADEASLKNFFETFGTVLECKIIMDRNTGCSKGYGFVTFADAEIAQNVKQQGNLFFLGKMMNVGDAYRKADPSGTGKGYRQGQYVQQPMQQAFRGAQPFVQPTQPQQVTAGLYGYYDPYQGQYFGQYITPAPGVTTQYATYPTPQPQAQFNGYYQQAQQQAWTPVVGVQPVITSQPLSMQSGILGDKPQPQRPVIPGQPLPQTGASVSQ